MLRLLIVLLLWPPCAGALCLFLINGLGDSGAFTEAPNIAFRSLRLATQEGFMLGVRASPLISVAPAAFVFAARRYWPRFSTDVLMGIAGAAVVFAAFLVWTAFQPLNPLLGGILPFALAVLLMSGAITGFLIARLRPRSNPPTPPT